VKGESVLNFLQVVEETACKNPHRHSAAGEESHIFLFKTKIKKEIF
jgi:hypothetical protein